MNKEYYTVANHVFSVNRQLYIAYEPFHTDFPAPTVFDIKIKLEKFRGKLEREIISQKENDVEISVGTLGNKLYYEFRLIRKRAAVLFTDFK